MRVQGIYPCFHTSFFLFSFLPTYSLSPILDQLYTNTFFPLLSCCVQNRNHWLCVMRVTSSLPCITDNAIDLAYLISVMILKACLNLGNRPIDRIENVSTEYLIVPELCSRLHMYLPLFLLSYQLHVHVNGRTKK